MASRVMNADIFEQINKIYDSLPNGELKDMITTLEDTKTKQAEITESMDSIQKGLEDVR
tara:strand:- start:319 stop:495 length:177 start_codon:yes stop_codon:yes gene_type:complete